MADAISGSGGNTPTTGAGGAGGTTDFSGLEAAFDKAIAVATKQREIMTTRQSELDVAKARPQT